jgi:hypothetical protein
METTPTLRSLEASPYILALCKSIRADIEPYWIKVEPVETAQLNECFYNVRIHCNSYGGQEVCGWIIWFRPNQFVMAEAHAIWKDINGHEFDITPKADAETKILFLPDETVVFVGQPIPSKYLACTNSLLVKRFIELKKHFEIFCSNFSGVPMSVEIGKMVSKLEIQINEINSQLNLSTERNLPCPCQSELKYKKCCGRHDWF